MPHPQDPQAEAARAAAEGRPLPADPSQAAAGLLQGIAGIAGMPPWLQALPPAQQHAVIELGQRTYGRDWNPAYASEAAVTFLLQRTQAMERFDTGATRTVPAISVLGAPIGQRQEPVGPRYSFMGARIYPKRVTIPQAGVDAARAAAPASAPFLKDIITTANRYNVPWQLVWGIIRKESSFNPGAVGDGGKSHGLAQIYGPAHPDISPSRARDPKFAIDFIARNLAANFGKFKDWGLAVLAHNSPQAAQHMFAKGKSSPRRAPFDKAYLAGVFEGLDKLGFDFRDVNQDGIEAALQAGSSAGSAVTLPDPAATRQRVTDYLRSLYFREPTADEVERLVDVVNGAVTQAAVQKEEVAFNPFADQQNAEFMRGGTGGIVNPLPGAKTTGRYGDKRPGRTHAGNDLAAPEGTPTFAAVSGYVEHRNDPKGYGTYIILRGDDGRRYLYGHLSARTVPDGAHVPAGAVIGKVGNTGRSTGPHLHFEIHDQRGRKINPEPELAGATALADEHEVQSGELATTTEVDPEARLLETIRGSAEYRQLYAHKPPHLTETEYAQRYIGEGEALLGRQPSGEAIRAGLTTGIEGVTAGYVAGTPEAAQSATFRQRLFKTAELFNRMA